MKRNDHDKTNVNGIERAASVLGGGALLATGLRGGLSRGLSAGSIGGALAAAAGAGLIYRGVTGHCGVYQALGVSTTRDASERGVVVRRSVTVRRSIEDVYRLLREFDTMPQIQQRLRSVEDLGDGAYHWRYEEGPVTLDIVTELIADEPNHRLSWITRPGSDVRCDGDVVLIRAPGDRGTEIHAEIAIAPPGGRATMLVAPVLRRVARHQLGDEFRRLKQLMETGEITTSATQPQRELESTERTRTPIASPTGVAP